MGIISFSYRPSEPVTDLRGVLLVGLPNERLVSDWPKRTEREDFLSAGGSAPLADLRGPILVGPPNPRAVASWNRQDEHGEDEIEDRDDPTTNPRLLSAVAGSLW